MYMLLLVCCYFHHTLPVSCCLVNIFLLLLLVCSQTSMLKVNVHYDGYENEVKKILHKI
jgi:hypothetical protein